MRVLGLAKRIMLQLARDKRTLALIFIAPLFILTLLSLIFDADPYEPVTAIVAEEEMLGMLEVPDDIDYLLIEEEAFSMLEDGELDGFLILGSTPEFVVEGSDPTVNGAAMKELQGFMSTLNQSDVPAPTTQYLYGDSEMAMFDSFGPVLLGFFVFFFVFLISGISFLRERTSGTLERLLASPMKIWELVVGYVIGFGVVTILQATFIAWFGIYVLDLYMTGDFFTVLLIILLLSFSALTLGILLSAFAQTELQMMQFIPLIVIPQIFFSGLFNLETVSEWLQGIGLVTPLYYAADALRGVMIKGLSITDIGLELFILFCFSFVFILLNIAALRKYRRI
ncbi:ABC transporter permease [Bacillus coahuilensis p1.1.43]|uniref:ABC transporter permease n=1 Tax=Bacillus coahuilensis p1.1.43 TaxID=1150625 RepID=A0A147K3W9_9BACI|nr:ABC transporter permease [Bacillus coahuilensis]KUP03983.1 ABC transporter permease [Bacillus coahuilensis p1.1.43]